MRIAYYVANLDGYSGAAYQALRLAQSFPPNYDFHIFNISKRNRFSKEKLSKNICIYHLPKNPIISIALIIYYNSFNGKNIHHMHCFSLIGLIALKAAKGKLILKTTLYGDDDFLSVFKSRFGKLKLWLARDIDMNIVLSNHLMDINSKFIDMARIVKIYNGVHIEASFASDSKKNKFCIVGIIHPRKNTYEGIKYYLQNFSSLPESSLTIVGPLANDDNLNEFDYQYLEDCRRLAKGNGKVHFVGKLTRNEVKKVYRESKCLIFFSEREGMPNVVLEAMHENCVPIMFPLNGTASEIITHGVNGFILDNFEAINVRLIDKIVSERSAVKRIEDEFSIGLISRRYQLLYKNLLGKYDPFS